MLQIISYKKRCSNDNYICQTKAQMHLSNFQFVTQLHTIWYCFIHFYTNSIWPNHSRNEFDEKSFISIEIVSCKTETVPNAKTWVCCLLTYYYNLFIFKVIWNFCCQRNHKNDKNDQQERIISVLEFIVFSCSTCVGAKTNVNFAFYRKIWARIAQNVVLNMVQLY